MTDVSRETLLHLLPAGDSRQQLQAYHDALAGAGVDQGLIGPREVGRLWERHLGNCAWVVLPEPGLVPTGARVADVGSGAGLPGLVWAIVRPDLHVTLIEPLLRRATYLSETVEQLGLADRVDVLRDRAENLAGTSTWDIVTARAVAPLERLLGWTLPLVAPGGRLLALKGASAAEEIARSGRALRKARAGGAAVVLCGQSYTTTPTRVVVVDRDPPQRG